MNNSNQNLDPEDEKIKQEFEVEWIDYLSDLEWIPESKDLRKLFHAWISGYLLKSKEDETLIAEMKKTIEEQKSINEKLNVVICLQQEVSEQNKRELRELKRLYGT